MRLPKEGEFGMTGLGVPWADSKAAKVGVGDLRSGVELGGEGKDSGCEDASGDGRFRLWGLGV